MALMIRVTKVTTTNVDSFLSSFLAMAPMAVSWLVLYFYPRCSFIIYLHQWLSSRNVARVCSFVHPGYSSCNPL